MLSSLYSCSFQVWINDYHLMLLPGLVREKLPHAVIGFFLHIPFPSSELFRCLPSKCLPVSSLLRIGYTNMPWLARKELLSGMLEADLVGFQTYSFARHFLQTCSRILSLDTSPSGIQMDSHYVSIGIFPIGIDIDTLNKKRLVYLQFLKNGHWWMILYRSAPEVQRSVEMLQEKYAGKKLIVARDKLDYIKGVRQKLLAFEQFLIRHPEWREKVKQDCKWDVLRMMIEILLH